jgi:hypothetical protein
MITAVPQELAAAFALLRRSQVPNDLFPEDRRERYQEGRVGQLGLNPALARRAETPLGNVWVIPGDGWICLSLAASPGPSSLDGGGLTCNRIKQALAGRIITWTSSRSEGATIVQGLVPDGIPEVTLTAADGSAQTVSVSDNTYGAVLSGALASVRLGGETVLRLGVPGR